MAAKKQVTQGKKKNVHPDFRVITVVMTDGSKFNVRSTYKRSDTLTLEQDKLSHHAWKDTKRASANQNDENVKKFNKKFGGFNLFNLVE